MDAPAVAIPQLVHAIFAGDSDARSAALEAADAIAARTTPGELVQLDEACRRAWPYHELAVDRTWLRRQARGPHAVTVVGLASLHPSGYVREAAVSELAEMNSGDELPFLLIRLNDWVDQVATRAEAAVAARITARYAPALVRSLPIVAKLEQSTRRDHRPMLDTIYTLLREPAQRPALERGSLSSEPTTRRTSWRLLREADPGRAEVLAAALRVDDLVVRLAAAREARLLSSDAVLAALMPLMLRDPSMPVRREALLFAAERVEMHATGALERGLLDRHRSVREVARFYLRKLGTISDFRAFYLARLRSGAAPTELAAALAGLGEVGTAEDARLVEQHVGDARAPVRKAALLALGRLDFDGQRATVVAALSDRSPGVAHAARDVLRKRAGAASGDSLAELVRTAPFQHTRLDALSLVERLGKWESIPILIEAAAASDARLRESARVRVRRWSERVNRSFVEPLPAQLERIAEALRANRAALDGGVAEEIGEVLRYWTGRVRR